MFIVQEVFTWEPNYPKASSSPNRYFPSPDWLIGLVADVETSSLELDDVTFLQVLQTGISKHLLLQLKE